MKNKSAYPDQIRYILAMMVVMFFVFSGNSKAQNSDLQLEVSVQNCTDRKTEDGAITIVLKSNVQSCTYLLYDKEPWLGGEQLLTSDETNQSEHTFSNLKVGTYLVCVIDDKDYTSCQKTTVSK